MSVLKETTDLDRLVSSGLAYSEVKACLLPARLQLDGLKKALRAALARAERAEALVMEAGVMLKEWDREYDRYREWEGRSCSKCGKSEDANRNPHNPGCPYAALLARIAELEKP